MTKLTAGIVAAVLVLFVAALVFIQQQTQSRLREKDELLQQQSEQLAQLAAENERLSNTLAQATAAEQAAQTSELLRLRSEVGQLRKQTSEVARLREENRRLQAAKATPETPPSQADPAQEQVRLTAQAKLGDAMTLVLAFHMYAKDNQNRLPATLEQANPYLGGTGRSLTQTNLFEVVYRGSLDDLTNRSSTIVVREQQPWPSFRGGWNRTYGFADGHSEVHHSDDGNFQAWEAQHSAAPAAGAEPSR